MSTTARTYPIDGIFGAAMRIFGLFGVSAILAIYADHVASTDGISMRFGGYAAWAFWTPTFTSLLSFALGLRGLYWLLVTAVLNDQQIVLWRRNLALEFMIGGLGLGCLLLGNVPGMASDLGPFGMIAVIIGACFAGNPQATLIDGVQRRVVVSGLLLSKRLPYATSDIAPLCVYNTRTRRQSWYVGWKNLPISPEVERDEAYRVARYVGDRTSGSPLMQAA